MTKKTRKIIFYISLLLFIILSPIMVFYSMGYKLDLSDMSLQKTGGIFIKINYENYDIYINKKLKKTVKQSPFSNKGVLIPNLIPKIYQIEIKKDGYVAWKKNLKVKSGLVTEIKNVLLIPEKLTIKNINYNDVLDFKISPNQKVIIYANKNYIIKRDITTNIENKIPLKNYNISKIIEYSEKENRALLSGDRYFISVNFKNNEIYKIKKSEYIKISYNPKKLYEVFALNKNNTLNIINIKDNYKKIYLKNINNFYIEDEYIIYTSTDPVNFYKINILSQKTEQLTLYPLKNLDYKSKIIEKTPTPIALINNNNELLLFNKSTEKFEKIFSNILDLSISPDLSKIIFNSKHEIYVYYLKESYPQRKSGEIILLGRFKDKIQKIKWVGGDNQHILLKINNNLHIMELDYRDKKNSYKIAENIDKFSYNYIENSIYFIKNKTLSKINLK